ncbi:Fungal Zn(2)-Cys(6) binuclear cluster domain [Geosmithia morbida]|uniref:Fungal Zn(2)-Cys(6) binuclear cluster domain n=1 Tax=Geosmithia morbida TaxID=1094350 RepID=A0A9P4YS34_9HYPO|nr:Fungal Zn(2)-Cys(6) binuclear cluster domain [Geosmithia morbida]KAF4120759.1 Fungal Zn(2)-Cys(6) binuclear cluster domain [Geosmithia morbida]
MHHFTTVTYDSLPKGPGRQEFWQLSLPRLAFGYDFLLHQILAITGFHMADLYPERRSALSTRALQHQEKAFRGLCQAVPDLTGTNCHAIFATASLLTISAFAAFTENVAQEGHKPNIDNLMEAFSLIRGMNHILTRYEPILLDGPMGQLLQLGVSRHETPLLASTAISLSKLVIPEDTDPVVRDICQHEVTKFIKFMEYPTSKAAYPELRAALSWPIVLSEEFVGLLHRRNAVALDILVYYCRILDHAGSCTWYMRGWGRCIHEDIATSRRANYGGHATTQTFA